MDKYSIKIYSRAYRDLEQIFAYIAEELLEPAIALEMIDGMEAGIVVDTSYYSLHLTIINSVNSDIQHSHVLYENM